MKEQQEIRERITSEILRLEQLLISTCKFELDFGKFIDSYTERYLKKMYPNHCLTGGPFMNLAQSIVNDSYFTYASLAFSTQSLSFAISIFAAKFYGLEIIFQEEEEKEELITKEVEQDSSIQNEINNLKEEELKLVRNPKFDFSYMAKEWIQQR